VSVAMVESKTLAQRYDLLPKMSNYLDPQLVFALTEFIRTRDIYDGREVLEAQVKLLWNTNMVEFTMEIYKELHGPNSTSQELEERKQVVIQRIGQLQSDAQKMIDVISNQTTVQGLRSDRAANMTYLKVCDAWMACIRSFVSLNFP
jgi:translation initiation factor 3 subunit E